MTSGMWLKVCTYKENHQFHILSKEAFLLQFKWYKLYLDILINSLHISGNQQFDFDTLNMAGIGKKLDALAKIKDCSIISKWKQSITNHMYWSAGSTQDNDGDMIVAKWESVVQHVQNVHTNHPNHLFPSCVHDPLEEDDEREIEWLQPSN